MPEGDALSLGDIQKKFTDSLQVIEELKMKLTTLAQTELASVKAGDQLKSASNAVEEASSELKSFAGMAKSAIEEFGVAMAEAGRVVQQTTLTELESSVASIRSLLESTVIAAQARAEAAEVALAKIPEKYRAKFSK
jgi:hypothetical protein